MGRGLHPHILPGLLLVISIAAVVVLTLVVLSVLTEQPQSLSHSPATHTSHTTYQYRRIGEKEFTQQEQMALMLLLKEHQINSLRYENYLLWSAITKKGNIHRQPAASAGSIGRRFVSKEALIWKELSQ